MSTNRPPAPEGRTQQQRQDELRTRLETGYRRINDARALGLDTRKLEEFWDTLLRQYEAAYGVVYEGKRP